MIINANIPIGIILGRIDLQGCRLPAPLVAARGVARQQAGKQAFGEGESSLIVIFIKAGLQHAFADQHIARDGNILPPHVAAPIDAVIARMGGTPTVFIQHMDLADRAAIVITPGGIQGCVNRVTGRQAIQYGRAQPGVRHRLASHRADATSDPRYDGADGKKSRGDSDAQGAAFRVMGNNRPSHPSSHCRY